MMFADVSDNGASDPEYGTANQDLHFINNTVILDPSNKNSAGSAPPAFVSLGCLAASYSSCTPPPNGPSLTVPAVVENNIFLGAETEATNQTSAFQTNNLLQSNSAASNLSALHFNNAAAFDFRLTSGSPAIQAGAYPPTNNVGTADPKALATYQYVNPVSRATWPTPTGSAMDAGAFPAQTISSPSLSLTYTQSVQVPGTGTIKVTGLPTPASGQYNYAVFLSSNQAAIPQIESVASTTGSVTTTFNTVPVTSTTVVPIYIYVDGTVLTANVTVSPAVAGPASIAAVSGSGQTATVGTSFPSPLVAIVKDATNNPLSGVTVTFAGKGVSFPSGATAITNSSGQAQVSAQPTTSGSLTVTASVSGVSTPATFSETGSAGTSSSISFVQAPASCVSGSKTNALTCTFAHPVAAGDVLIASVMPLLTPGASPFTASVADSLNGVWVHGAQCYSAYNAQADFFYLSNTAAGSDTVTLTYSSSAKLYLSVAEYSGVDLATPFDVAPTCTSFLPRGKSFTGPSLMTSATSDMLISSMIVGNAGTTTVSSPYVLRVGSNVTMADLKAGTAGTQSGPRWSTQYSQDGFVVGAALKAAGGGLATATSVAVVSGSGQSATVNTNFSNPLVVVVKDASNNPVAGVTVSFAGTGVSFPSGATASTASNGQAQVIAQPAATGSLSVSASVVGVSSPAMFAETGTAPAPASIAVVSGSGQSASVNTNFPNPLVAVVKDASNNPVPGVTVTFAGTGVSFPSGATAITNSTGQAQVTAQPTSTGSLTVTASVAGVATSALFSETGTTATTPTISAVSGSGQSAPVGSNFTNPLVISVTNGGTPVSGVSVTFSGSGVSFPSGATAVTNSSGQAQVTAQPATTGALTITATATGVSGVASFSETGSTGVASSIAFVQAPAVCVSSGTSSTVTCTFAQPIAAGDTIIASAKPLLTPGTSPFTASVADTVNGAWTHGVQCYSAYNGQADFFYFTNTRSGSDTVTVTYSSSAKLYLRIAEYSGVNISTPFDVAPTCSAYIPSMTTYIGPALTLSASTDMLISTLNVGNGGTTTVSAPYSLRVADGEGIADYLSGTAGTQAGPTWHTQYSQNGFVMGAALKAAN